MRVKTEKKISQLRRRRRMLGRKLLPKLKRVLQSGRVAKPIHTSREWTVTPFSQVDESLVRTVPSATSAVSTNAARHRTAAVDIVKRGVQNICRGFEDSCHDFSELSQERQYKDSARRRRQRKKRRMAAPPVQPASEEDEPADKHSSGSAGCSDDDDEDDHEDAVAASDSSSGDENVSDEDSSSVSSESDNAGTPDMLNKPQAWHEGHKARNSVGSDDEQGMDEEEGAQASGSDLGSIFVAPHDQVLVVVQPPAVLQLVGRAQLCVLHGMVDVEGSLLMCAEHMREGRRSCTVVQSGFPMGIVYVKPLPCGRPSRTTVPLRRTLAKLGLAETWPRLRPCLAHRSAVILLAKVPGGEWPIDLKSTARLRGAFRTLGFRMHLDETSSISPCHPWRAEAASLAKHLLSKLDSPEGRVATPCILVCGRQNSGKSSVLRLCVNSFLNLCREVLYLDCDPGQCEFTPPATVSLTRVTRPLMGPPFTHIRTPEKAYFLGHVSPASQPDAYCEAVRALIEHARKVSPQTPLFVNTMGWISGLGLSLLVDVIRWARPTDVIQLLADEGTTDLPPLDNDMLQSACGWMTSQDGTDQQPPLAGVTYHPLPGSTFRGRSLARIMREAMVLGYLGQRVGTGLSQPLPEAYHWLWNTVPMRVPWSAVAVHDCDSAVPKEELLHSLCGSVVALCVVPNSKLLETEDSSYPKFVDDCGPYECLGYGLVRAIDPSERLFYIISPEPQERLTKVNALIRGDLHLPETLLTSQAQLLQCSWAPYVTRASCDPDNRGSPSEAEDTASCC
ncbi:uncharacterized protein LOC144096664 [Amblyomma americanum]